MLVPFIALQKTRTDVDDHASAFFSFTDSNKQSAVCSANSPLIGSSCTHTSGQRTLAKSRSSRPVEPQEWNSKTKCSLRNCPPDCCSFTHTHTHMYAIDKVKKRKAIQSRLYESASSDLRHDALHTDTHRHTQTHTHSNNQPNYCTYATEEFEPRGATKLNSCNNVSCGTK